MVMMVLQPKKGVELKLSIQQTKRGYISCVGNMGAVTTAKLYPFSALERKL